MDFLTELSHDRVIWSDDQTLTTAVRPNIAQIDDNLYPLSALLFLSRLHPSIFVFHAPTVRCVAVPDASQFAGSYNH